MNKRISRCFMLSKCILFIFTGSILQCPIHASPPAITSLRLGFTSGTLYDVDINDARAAQSIWLETVLKNVNKTELDITVTSTLYDNIQMAAQALKNNEVDVLICLPIEYLALPKTLNISPTFTSRTGTELGENYILVTHKKSAIQNLEQLQSVTLMMSQKGNNQISKLWLDTLLLQNNLPVSEAFFGTIKNVSKTTQAILPVFFKQADACLIPKTDLKIAQQLNPQLATDLHLLAQSPPFNRVIVCAQNNIYKNLADRLHLAIDIVNQTQQGKQLLTLFRVKQMIRFEETHLDNIKHLVQTYENLSHNNVLSQYQLISP